MKFKVCILDETLEEPIFIFSYEVKGWPLPENKKGSPEDWASNRLDDLTYEIAQRNIIKNLLFGYGTMIPVSLFFFDHDNDLLFIEGPEDFLNFLTNNPIKLFVFDKREVKLAKKDLWKRINSIKQKLI